MYVLDEQPGNTMVDWLYNLCIQLTGTVMPFKKHYYNAIQLKITTKLFL